LSGEDANDQLVPEVYLWGSTKEGGMGETLERHPEILVPTLSEELQYDHVLQMACGANFTVILTIPLLKSSNSQKGSCFLFVM
jgi:alpha-tubulin suppressor-like RCC1 family protein